MILQPHPGQIQNHRRQLLTDKICEEAANYLHSPVPLRFKEHLDAKAERCYARHRQFRKLIRARGNNGRDSLASFMRHWLYALLHKQYRALAQRLQSFAIGHPLPLRSVHQVHQVHNVHFF